MAAENICADVRLDDFTVELKPEDIPGNDLLYKEVDSFRNPLYNII
jgi:hypothetical protein